MLEDFRYVLRSWRARPAFFAMVALTLTLGVALASAVFAFADGYLFRPLPFPSADQLYRVSDPKARIASALLASDTAALRQSVVGSFGFVEWALTGRVVGDLLIDGRRVGATAYEVSQGFKGAIGLPLLAGRDFDANEHRKGGTVPAWLSHRFWTREFSGDPDVLNRSFRVEHLSGESFDLRVVGILGPEVASFDLNNPPPEMVVPGLEETNFGPNRLSFPLVRLPDGMSREEGEIRIAQALQAVAPASDGRPRSVRLRSLRDAQVAGGRPTALTFFIGAMLVVLLAAVNLVHLLLVRGVSRSAEIATRAALGASRWRIARLFILESLSVGAVGIAGGLLLGAWLAAAIRAQVPIFPTAGRNLSLVPMLFDWRVVIFAAGLGLAVALLAGCWPAWRTLRRPLTGISRSHRQSAAAVPARIARVILACELALATIVMLGTVFAGLGIWRYLHQPLGFDYTDRFTISIRPSEPRRASPVELAAAARAIRELPGVTSAGPYDVTPIPGIEVPGRAIDPATVAAYGTAVGYYESWNLRMRAGRWFFPAEDAQAAVAVVDQRFAALMWPGADPIGREIRVGRGAMREVVGVIEAPRWSLIREARPTVYIPVPADTPGRNSRFVAWMPGATLPDVSRRVEAAVRAAVPDADVLVNPVTFDMLFLHEVGEARFQTPFMIVFGLLAFALAGVGVFGVVSYVVERRTREFGIRLALGARSGDVWRSVTLESVVPAMAGLAIGIAGARALERIVQASVFGWQSSGAWAVSIVAIVLFGVAVAAAAGPARRAVRIDPVVVLRMD